MKMTKKVGTALSLAGTLTLGSMVMAAPAEASSYCAYQGSDRACGVTYSTYDVHEVCDNEADGNGVYAYFYDKWGGINRVNDGNGSASGCGRETWDHNGIYAIEICEDDWGDDTCVYKRY